MYRATLTIILTLTGVTGCATVDPTSSATAVGTVDVIYVEVAPDLYASQSLLERAPAHDYWVTVTVATTPGAPIMAMASVPATLALAPGDAVAVRFDAQGPRNDTEQFRGQNRVLGVVARASAVAGQIERAPDALDRYLSEATATGH